MYGCYNYERNYSLLKTTTQNNPRKIRAQAGPTEKRNCYNYEGSYFQTRSEGGAYGSGATPIHGGWSDGPINPDSYSSWMIFDGIFDRFEKFSFWAKIGRLKVRGADFPIVNPTENYKGF